MFMPSQDRRSYGGGSDLAQLLRSLEEELTQPEISDYGHHGPPPHGHGPPPHKPPPSNPPPSNAPGSGSSDFVPLTSAAAVADNLDGGGYNVQEGGYMFFFLKDCETYKLPSCYALNGASPYGLALLPSSPVENIPYLGQLDTGEIGDGCPRYGYPEITQPNWVCKDDTPTKWRIGYDEGVVIMGLTPPDAIYWGFTSYIFSQFYNDSARVAEGTFAAPLQKASVSCPDGPARCQQGASLGTSYNKYMNTQDPNTDGTGIMQPFAIVMAANLRNLTKHVRELRLHLCQTSPASLGARTFVEQNYVEVKRNNPDLPILIRECSGVQPRIIARYDYGVEKMLPLNDMSADEVVSSIEALARN